MNILGKGKQMEKVAFGKKSNWEPEIIKEMYKEREKGLVGLHFHSFIDGRLVHQGRVINRIDEKSYEVVHYEWFDGNENGTKIASLDEMATWSFYSTPDQMARMYHRAYSKFDVVYARRRVALTDKELAGDQ